MHPTTVSHELALIAVISLSISVVINLYRVLFPARRRRSHRPVEAIRANVQARLAAISRMPRPSLPRKRVKPLVGVANS